MSPQNSTARMVRLDGLRGVAVLSVLLFHTGPFLIPSVAPDVLPGGFLGVDLFFVLSGFLMTNILLDPARSYGRFYLRRAARIFPALYVMLAVHFVYSMIVGVAGGADLRVYGLISVGLGNWETPFGLTVPFSIGQTWSLGVEEQLYLVWPLVLILCGRRDLRRLKWLCTAGIVASFAFTVVMFRSGVPADHIYFQTPARLGDFLVGALVATIWESRDARGRPFAGFGVAAWIAACFLAACLAVARPFSSGWLYDGGFTAVAACCGIVLYACLRESTGTAFLTSRPLRAAGRYSYSIYLWHPFVFEVVGRAFPHDTAVRVMWAAVLLTVTSVLSTLALEEPLRRLAANATKGRSLRQPRAGALVPTA